MFNRLLKARLGLRAHLNKRHFFNFKKNKNEFSIETDTETFAEKNPRLYKPPFHLQFDQKGELLIYKRPQYFGRLGEAICALLDTAG